MPDPSRPEASSPKKFFKSFNVSPFRHSNRHDASSALPPAPDSFSNNTSAQTQTFSFQSRPSTTSSVNLQSIHQPHPQHGRSQSHEIFHSRNNLSLKSWASLIPPVPNQSRHGSGSSSRELKVHLNRHTIAILPTGSKELPDMLQPLPNPDMERTFIVSRGSNSASPISELYNDPGLYFSHASPPMSQNHLSSYLNQSTSRFQQGRQNSNTPPARPSERIHARLKLSQNAQTPPQPPPAPPQFESHRLQEAIFTVKLNNNPFVLSSNSQQTQQQYPQPYQQHSMPQNPSQQWGPQQRQMSIPSAQPQTQPQSQPASHPLQSSTQFVQKQSPRPKRTLTEKKRKVCNKCGQIINGQFVRALGSAYHIDCFTCYQCGKQCSAKFFPQEIVNAEGQTVQVPLCEYDYFKKLDLICIECNNALRGPYITALGNKYHLEHFKCFSCGKVFDSDESYYEHENHIYCHLHYSKLFATKCEGCQSSIVKQFVELFKGGRNQHWHPECYMVFKFWNVYITADCVGLQEKLKMDVILANLNEIEPEDLLIVEQQIERVVLDCWLVLSGFEEIAANCISEMLLSACTGKRASGLFSTGKLVLYVEVLFDALDFVQKMCLEYKAEAVPGNDTKSVLTEEVYSVDAFDKFQTLRKEPRNISGKLMSYLAILRKSNQISDSGSLSAELLSVVTGCAHYLKLLLRIGLNNALKLNKFRGDIKALEGFLKRTKQFEDIESADKLQGDSRISIGSRLAVPINATDACRACLKSIEKSCVRYKNMRWHMKCFECSKCKRQPNAEFIVESFLYGPDDLVICTECARTGLPSNLGYSSGFVKVTDLAQLAYLLKIAIFRSRSAIKKDSDKMEAITQSAAMTNIEEEPSESENEYSRTLNDVTTLRKKRESQKLSNSVKKNARKSVILEAPSAAVAKKDNTIEDLNDTQQARKGSTSSSLSFAALQNEADQFDFLNSFKIRDDPPQRVTSHSLDRTSDLLKNEKSLTLDDIPRIVAAEQAREQRPNAFKHHNSLYQKRQQPFKTLSGVGNSILRRESMNQYADTSIPGQSSNNKYYSELSKREHFILRHIAVEALLEANDTYSRDELISLIQTRKLPTFWDKFKFGGGEKSKQLNVFGVDLTEVTKKYGVDSDLGVGPAQLRIPILVDDVINALRQKDMSVEGIFRLNGNIKNLRELTEQINKVPLKSPAFGNYSAVQLAALMKKWLRELPNPLLTFNLYELWIQSRKGKDPIKCKRILALAYCMLPRSHRNLLEVLLYFFSWVASFAEIDEETGSKMDTHNLATVIAPNILLSKASSVDGGNSQSSESHFIAIEVVNQLIEVHEELAIIPPDLWAFYEKCQFQNAKVDTISTKEILTKISKVSKENPGFFRGYAANDANLTQTNAIRSGQAQVHNDGTSA